MELFIAYIWFAFKVLVEFRFGAGTSLSGEKCTFLDLQYRANVIFYAHNREQGPPPSLSLSTIPAAKPDEANLCLPWSLAIKENSLIYAKIRAGRLSFLAKL